KIRLMPEFKLDRPRFKGRAGNQGRKLAHLLQRQELPTGSISQGLERLTIAGSVFELGFVLADDAKRIVGGIISNASLERIAAGRCSRDSCGVAASAGGDGRLRA